MVFSLVYVHCLRINHSTIELQNSVLFCFDLFSQECTEMLKFERTCEIASYVDIGLRRHVVRTKVVEVLLDNLILFLVSAIGFLFQLLLLPNDVLHAQTCSMDMESQRKNLRIYVKAATKWLQRNKSPSRRWTRAWT
uniref:Uncharacterized protein n=1 Tax=Aegilops tauschii subsp. strangulata TaxID=200361 RepID=A0A453JJ55_AEGTS